MSQNGQPHFKNLAVFVARLFLKCLTISGHYALKGLKRVSNLETKPIALIIVNWRLSQIAEFVYSCDKLKVSVEHICWSELRTLFGIKIQRVRQRRF